MACRFDGPGHGALLGTDALGRDALSRTLWGGRSVLGLAGTATLIAYLAGATIGLVAGYLQGPVDGLVMRGVDVLVSVPALLFILVLVTGAGTSNGTLVVAVAVVQAPLIARVVRSATLEQSFAPSSRRRSPGASARARSSSARSCPTSCRP